MNNLFKKVIVSIIALSVFLAPVSPSFEKNSQSSIKINQISAEENTGAYYYLVTIKDQGNGKPFEFPSQDACNTARNTFLSSTTYTQNTNIYTSVSDCIPKTGSFIDPNKPAIEEDPAIKETEHEYGCGLNPVTWFTNCIALALYAVVWTPVAAITRVAARILDFFIYYSTNSNSYNSGFIRQGWAAVRDIANIFFIIALLYIAIKMILGMAGHDGKKIIGMVVIMALLINFSLFFTQIIIDSSNILAKVFYNNITSVDKSGQPLPANSSGEKSITVKLASLFNPHDIMGIQVKDEPGQFIFVTIVSIALMLFMVYIFISVAMLFVGRVVSLWLAMIFAPIAFASYTLPFDIPGIGHKEWWSELFKNAFLAPIFIFLLYIIVMFGDFMGMIKYDVADAASWTDSIMKTVIPFAIVFILLIKAKEMAVKYAGEMGAMMSKAGAFIGGAAVGAATGGLAMAGRGLIGGQIANRLNNSEKFNTWASKSGVGRKLKSLSTAASKGSFDLRGIKIAGKDLGSTGLKVNAIGGPQVGGFEAAREKRQQKRDRRAAEASKLGEYEPKKMALKEAEIKEAEIKNHIQSYLDDVDKEIETAKEARDNAIKNHGDKSEQAIKAKEVHQEALDKKAAIMKGEVYAEKAKDENGNLKKVTKERTDEKGNVIMKTIQVPKEIPDGIGGTRTIMEDKEVPDTYEEFEIAKDDDGNEKIKNYGEHGSLKEASKKVKAAKEAIHHLEIERRENAINSFLVNSKKEWIKTTGKVINTLGTFGGYSDAEMVESNRRMITGTKPTETTKKPSTSHDKPHDKPHTPTPPKPSGGGGKPAANHEHH